MCIKLYREAPEVGGKEEKQRKKDFIDQVKVCCPLYCVLWFVDMGMQQWS